MSLKLNSVTSIPNDDTLKHAWNVQKGNTDL